MPTSSRTRAAADADFHLVLPTYLPHWRDSERNEPQLDRLLAYGEGQSRSTRLASDYEPWQLEVLDALGWEAAFAASGPLTWLGTTSQAISGWWAHIELIQLSVSAQGLSLQPARWTAAEVASAADALSGLCVERGFALKLAAERLFLHTDRNIDVQTSAPRPTQNGSLRELLPNGRDGVTLRQLITEAQMVLHQKFPNAGFNSIWIWGGARMPKPQPRQLPRAISNEPFVHGLYRLSEAADRITEGTEPDALTDCRFAVIRANGTAAARPWLEATLRALETRKLASASISLDGVSVALRYSRWRQWFAKPQPLQVLEP